MPTKETQIALGIDVPFLRQSLVLHLNKIAGYNVCLSFSDKNELLSGLAEMEKLPDICILGLSDKMFDGFKTLDLLQLQCPTVKIIVISVYSPEDTSITEKFLKHGAVAYLSNNSSVEDLENAISSVDHD